MSTRTRRRRKRIGRFRQNSSLPSLRGKPRLQKKCAKGRAKPGLFSFGIYVENTKSVDIPVSVWQYLEKEGAPLASLTPPQCRAARGLLDWSQIELAERSELSESTVRDFEKGRRTPSQTNLDAIRRTLEEAGVEFIEGNQHGVRMRKMRAGDYVKFRSGALMGATFGDAVGVVLRDRPEVKMGSVERIDVSFPGHETLVGVESALFELFVPSDVDSIAAVCKVCGMPVKVKPTETRIDHLKYTAMCKHAEDRPAFDHGCPELRKAVSAAHQKLRMPAARLR